MKVLSYNVRLTKLREGGYMVTVPKLRGCVTWGKTYNEAITMAQEAIQGFVEALIKAKQSVPIENDKEVKKSRFTMFVNVPTFA